jgi:hypothetical protein
MAKPTIKSIQPNWVGQPRFPNLSETFATAIIHWVVVSRVFIERKKSATCDRSRTVRCQRGNLCRSTRETVLAEKCRKVGTQGSSSDLLAHVDEHSCIVKSAKPLRKCSKVQ